MAPEVDSRRLHGVRAWTSVVKVHVHSLWATLDATSPPPPQASDSSVSVSRAAFGQNSVVAMMGERGGGAATTGSARCRRERRPPFGASARTDGSRDGCGRGDAPLLTRTEDCHTHQGGGGESYARSPMKTEVTTSRGATGQSR